MNNIELEQKIKEIIKIDNYFDMQIALNSFQSEYKKSDFYKTTKKALEDVIKECRIHYALQLEDLSRQIQRLLDNLSLDKVNELLDHIGATFGQENEEIGEILKDFKSLQ